MTRFRLTLVGLAAVLLTACAGEPLPLRTFQAVCNGVTTKFRATRLSSNDDPGEMHMAYTYVPGARYDGGYRRDVVARFDPKCSIAEVMP